MATAAPLLPAADGPPARGVPPSPWERPAVPPALASALAAAHEAIAAARARMHFDPLHMAGAELEVRLGRLGADGTFAPGVPEGEWEEILGTVHAWWQRAHPGAPPPVWSVAKVTYWSDGTRRTEYEQSLGRPAVRERKTRIADIDVHAPGAAGAAVRLSLRHEERLPDPPPPPTPDAPPVFETHVRLIRQIAFPYRFVRYEFREVRDGPDSTAVRLAAPRFEVEIEHVDAAVLPGGAPGAHGTSISVLRTYGEAYALLSLLLKGLHLAGVDAEGPDAPALAAHARV